MILFTIILGALLSLLIGGFYVIKSVINDINLHFDNDDDEFEYFN
jgi:hypothetical protein